VLVAPYCFMRAAMMAGTWAQHAFVDPAHPEDPYLSSITCINTRYNRRCFNDGYHIGHHLRANRHWTELPDELERNLAEYARRGALVFEGVDFFGVWLRLMLRNYEGLARRVVVLDGSPRPLAETVAMLRSRTRPISTCRAPHPRP
jgi:hypothetical protein